MEMRALDMTGLKCPQPVLKLAVAAASIASGDIVEVKGDCPTFEKDLRAWCDRMHKVCLSVREDGDVRTIQIQF